MLLIDKYAYFNRLKHVHPVEKVIFSLCLLLFVIIAKDSFLSLIIFIVMSAFTVLAAGIPFKYYIKLLLLPIFFLLSGVVTILLSFADGQVIVSNCIWSAHIGSWQVYISEKSVEQVGNLVAVVLSSISCLYFLTLTTPLTAILHVLQKVKLPLLFIELVALTYRFIFVFLDEAANIYQSQSSRLGYVTVRQGIKSLGLLVTVLFLKVFQRTTQLTIAMNSRGYEEQMLFFEQSYRYSLINWLIIGGVFTGMAVVYIQFGGSL
ncbi:cobalt ECF transporter T component CbiQ [Metabacillus fastidiosus]|uniref:Cobalt ECF transporter T component CbiQ n=1 Tax=Metabacillus fastidiosus TaxID=1458 RepID=A0ABU6P718_9BACI|nr:cobalt ECF transporter T component CbiQ [Metabacillus fastidiosus]MED4403961.1 cobalt ECF transporter T component CbiQ [Metabacillus fastidiosus]MED4461113.1 cobalt ECF transporter T component CbiQ [Metabacillus fastidiosus]